MIHREARPGRRLQAGLRQGPSPYRSAKGCRKGEMRQGIENPDDFLLLVWWDTLEDHKSGFRESPRLSPNGAPSWARCSPPRPPSCIITSRCAGLGKYNRPARGGDVAVLAFPPRREAPHAQGSVRSSAIGSAASRPGRGPYRILRTVTVGGDGGFDYIVADSAGRRLYIARSGKTNRAPAGLRSRQPETGRRAGRRQRPWRGGGSRQPSRLCQQQAHHHVRQHKHNAS